LWLPRAALAAQWRKKSSHPVEGAPCLRGEHFLVSFFAFLIFVLVIWGIMISLAGKAALITGGSRGIGAAAVKLFAQAGADVVFNYNKAKDAAEQVQQKPASTARAWKRSRRTLAAMPTTRNLWSSRFRAGPAGYCGCQRRVWKLEDLPIEKMSESSGTK